MLKKQIQRIIYYMVLLIGFTSCTNAVEYEPILPGSYQMDEYLNNLQSKDVGLVVNHTSVVGNTYLLDSLVTRGVNIKKVFAPEHGFLGNYDAGAVIEHDSGSLHVNFDLVSLYGNSRKPKTEDLDDIEVLVFDLQDVGTRFFTYISTLHYVMEACAEENIPLLVLDRPNPNGHYVDGPVLEPEHQSFVGMHKVPIVYGMSIGEYAQMINGEYWLADSAQCELSIIKCKHYDHNSRYTLPVAPSPNLPNMGSIYLYPSTCLLEGTVVSEGRGTEAPFQIIGHPNFGIGSYTFTPQSIPGASMNPKLKGEKCYGINLSIIPLDTLKKISSIDLSYLLGFYKELNLDDEFFTDYIDLLAGTSNFRKQVLEGFTEEQIKASWQDGLETFKKIRAKYLLYPDFE